MKMPSSTNVKVEAKPSTVSTPTVDAAQQCINCLEKKVRNLEKRKAKIEAIREKAAKGTKLEKEQEISLGQYDQVNHDLEFAKDLQKQFSSIYCEHEKIVKKQVKREKSERQAAEIKRVGEILHLQSTLDLLGGNEVREDFKTGKHGAVVLTEDNLDQLDKLYQAISPSRDDSGDEYPQRLLQASEHMVNILEGKDRQVLGTTYKDIKDLLTLINDCGYFERANKTGEEKDEVPQETEEAEKEDSEELEDSVEQPSADSVESTPEPQQQPIDLTVDGVQSQMDIHSQPQQPLNTIEQDAFFAPSSTTGYQEEPEAQYSSPVYRNAEPVPPVQSVPSVPTTNFESFTNNRPFQFIQTSYVMPDPQAQAPSVVDPAVIHAQPATGSGLSFMSAGFEAQSQSQTPPQPSSSSPPQQAAPPQVQAPQPTQTPQPEYTSQAFSQGSLPQSMQPTFNAAASVVDQVNQVSSRLPGQMRDDSSGYEIPPSIPMPPSQSQDQSQLDQQAADDKKFQMNVSAPVFQSMYAQQQVASGQSAPVSVPPPAVQDGGQGSGDFSNTGVSTGQDFQQGYQGNGFNNRGYSRGRGGGNFRGNSRGGGAQNGNRNAGQMQNGFSNQRGPNQSNGRGGGRGGGNFQGYPPNNNYRPDNYQGNNYSQQTGGFNKFQNRGGMNNSGGPGGNSGYQRAGTAGQGDGRTGGMRGGMSRGGQGGGPRGGQRGGFNRPPPQ